MLNDTLDLLADIPMMLVTAWVVWLGAGALLIMWFRRAKLEVELPAPAPRPRPKAVARPSSSPDMQTTATQSETAAERSRPAPVVVGDPYGELATLLDQPAAAPAAAPAEPRAPADSPILSSSGSPIRRANTNDPNPVA